MEQMLVFLPLPWLAPGDLVKFRPPFLSELRAAVETLKVVRVEIILLQEIIESSNVIVSSGLILGIRALNDDSGLMCGHGSRSL